MYVTFPSGTGRNKAMKFERRIDYLDGTHEETEDSEDKDEGSFEVQGP